VSLLYSTDELIARVKRTLQLRTTAGGGNLKLSDAQLLQICDEEIQQNLFPRLLSVREDLQEWRTPMAFTAGIGVYRVPFEAASSTFDHIELIQLNGATKIAQWRIPRVPVPDGAAFTGIGTGNTSTGAPRCYSVVGDQITFYPTPIDTTVTNFVAVIFHEMRPPRLCLTADTSTVISFVQAGSNISATVNAVPASWVATTPVDIVPSQPPFMPLMTNGTVYSIALLVVDIFPGYVTLTPAATVASLMTGTEYPIIVPRGYTNIFPLPDSWFSAAVLACSATVAINLGDNTAYEILRPEADGAIDRLVAFMSNRIRKEPQTIFDISSPMRRRGAIPGGWGGGIA
jgi:hypothetical protein